MDKVTKTGVSAGETTVGEQAGGKVVQPVEGEVTGKVKMNDISITKKIDIASTK